MPVYEKSFVPRKLHTEQCAVIKQGQGRAIRLVIGIQLVKQDMYVQILYWFNEVDTVKTSNIHVIECQ